MTEADLLFCRACGVSVARRELLAGRAFLVDGRAWCPSCAPGMWGRRRAVRWALGGAVLAAGGLVGWVLGAALRESAEALRRADGAAAAAAAAGVRIEGIGARCSALEAEARGLSALLEAEGRAVEAARKDGAASRDSIEDLDKSMGALLDAVEALRREIAAARGPAGPTPEEEEVLLRRLGEPNAGTRFEAIWRLQRGRGEAARRAAVKGLADPEDSVRYQAALLARDLKVREAIPALVEALADASAAVRAAAIGALKVLEGTDLGFDPLDPDASRRVLAVLRWKERIGGR